MPIWLRSFTWKKIVSHYNEEAEQNKKASQNANDIDMSNPDKKKMPKQTISPPSYVTKASRKK